MATFSRELTTKEKVKRYAGITGTTNDTLIDELIREVTLWVEGYTGRIFKQQTYTELYDTKRGDELIFLRQYPLRTDGTFVATVNYRNSDIANPTYTAFNANDYTVYDEEGYVKFFLTFPNASKYVQVIYTAGYLIDLSTTTAELDDTTNTLPFDITQLANSLVAQLYNVRTSQGIKSQSTEGQSITFAGGSIGSAEMPLTTTQMATLEKYKKHVFR